MKMLMPFAVVLPLVCGTIIISAAPKPADKDDNDAIKKLEGEWTIESWTSEGQDLPAEALGDTKWSVKGDKYTFEMGDSKEQGTIKLDAAKKPSTIDLAITSGDDKGKDQVGIYKVDGDTITFCLNRPGAKDRPSDFKSTEDNSFILIKMKKKKKKDD